MKKQLINVLTLGLVVTLFGCNDKENTIAPKPSPAPASINLTENYLPVGSIANLDELYQGKYHLNFSYL